MNSPETHDPIDKLLRGEDTYIADNGFTKRVMAALPRRRRMLPRLVLLAVAAGGVALTLFCLPWKNLPPLDYARLLNGDLNVLTAWLPFVAVVVVLASTALRALSRED